jgi:hypothetical protein
LRKSEVVALNVEDLEFCDEGVVLRLLASIRSACWLMATAIAGGRVPFVILALLFHMDRTPLVAHHRRGRAAGLDSPQRAR